jgi:riboflavin synthase
MFTGIIEDMGKIEKITPNGSNISYTILANMAKELKIDQSLSHDGVCLTVEEVWDNHYQVTAVAETLQKTNLHNWEIGRFVNLERCVSAQGRFDGHFVSGHVDTTAICTSINNLNGSWEYQFNLDTQFAANIIEKGSIAINGISLTIFNVGLSDFTVAIIPYTYTHTNMQQLKIGDKVNIELDMIGKYINRIKAVTNAQP